MPVLCRGAQRKSVGAARVYRLADSTGAGLQPVVEFVRIGKVALRRAQVAAGFALAGEQLAATGEKIVDQAHRIGSGPDEHEAPALRVVVDYRIAHKIE